MRYNLVVGREPEPLPIIRESLHYWGELPTYSTSRS